MRPEGRGGNGTREQSSRPLLGVAAAALGTLLLVSQDAVSKHLLLHVSTEEIMAWRGLFALPMILAVAAATGTLGRIPPRNIALNGTRALVSFATSVLIILSVMVVPFAEAMAILQLTPIFILVLSGPLLAERADGVGYGAVLAGLAGALLVLRPTGDGLDLLVFVPVAAALAAALQDISTRAAARYDAPVSLLFWTMAASALGGFAWSAATVGPVLPEVEILAWLVFAAALGAAAFFVTIIALDWASPARLAPVRYSAIVWGVLFGMLVWGEVPDMPALAGMILIALAGLAALRRRADL